MERGKFLSVVPIERIIKPDGNSVLVLDTLADSQKTVDEFCERAKELGIDIGPTPPADINSKTFGFNSAKWTGCNWEPKGPQPNWLSQKISQN